VIADELGGVSTLILCKMSNKQLSFTGPLQPTHSRLAHSNIWQSPRAIRPGPASYTVTSRPLGRNAVFGTEKKDMIGLPSWERDGPKFAHECSMGLQKTSKRPSSSRAHFGTSTREHTGIVYSAYTARPH
jgi:hypothetical protein